MTIVIREAGPADLEEVLQLRMRLFDKLVDFNNGKVVDEDLLQSTRTYFSEALQSGACKTWVAETNGHLVACGSLAIFIRPPYPGNVAGKDAYLLNMYTMAEYRKQGLARKILQQAVQYAREQGFATIWLHATEDGQALYASEGFEPSAKYMEWEVGAGV